MKEKERENTSYKETALNLIRFSIPLILSGVLQQLYSWADAFIVGNVEGEIALAAVGSTTSLVMFFTTLITGFSIGLSILFAERFGKREREEIPKILSSFSFLLALIFIALSLLASTFSLEMLRVMDTTEDAIFLASEYVSIVFLGLPFLAIYNVYSAALRGIGDSRTPFLAVLVSALTNVALDILFVAVFSLSVKGAAWATFISQALMTVFIVIYSIYKHKELRFSLKKKIIHLKEIKEGLSIGIPPMLQQSLTALGTLILQDFMNGFGTETVVAITTAYRVDSMLLLPIINLSSGIATMTAQERGRGNSDGIKNVKNSGLILMSVTAILLTLVVVPLGGFMISLFGAGENSVAIGSAFFTRLASFYIVFGLAMAYRGHIEGLGDVGASSIIGIFSLILRIILSYLWEDTFGNMVIAWAEAAAWCVMLALYMIRRRIVSRKLRL